MKKRRRRMRCKACRLKFVTNPKIHGWKCPECGSKRVIEIP